MSYFTIHPQIPGQAPIDEELVRMAISAAKADSRNREAQDRARAIEEENAALHDQIGYMADEMQKVTDTLSQIQQLMPPVMSAESSLLRKQLEEKEAEIVSLRRYATGNTQVLRDANDSLAALVKAQGKEIANLKVAAQHKLSDAHQRLRERLATPEHVSGMQRKVAQQSREIARLERKLKDEQERRITAERVSGAQQATERNRTERKATDDLFADLFRNMRPQTSYVRGPGYMGGSI